MTGRQKIEAALSPAGTTEVPVVLSCYEEVFQRDHWDDLTSYPWWYQDDPDLDRQMAWRREAVPKTGEDWFRVPPCASLATREREQHDEADGKVFWRDRVTGETQELRRSPLGGWPEHGYAPPADPPETPAAVDRAIPLPDKDDLAQFQAEGRDELARRLLTEFGAERFPNHRSQSPLLFCAELWGFEGLMVNIATRRELVQQACVRYLLWVEQRIQHAALLGAAGLWVVDGLCDLIAPRDYETLCLPLLQTIMEKIRRAGMHSIYFYTGDPAGKLDLILSLGADALAFEDPKKGFDVDVVALAERTRGRVALFGNLDAVGLLQDGREEQLRRELARQLSAAPRNEGRFIMSIGSPVTPGTSVARCRRFCELVHELAG